MQVLEQNLWKKNNRLQPSHIILCASDCAFQSKLIALIRIYCKQLKLNKPYLYTHTDALCIRIHNLHTNIYSHLYILKTWGYWVWFFSLRIFKQNEKITFKILNSFGLSKGRSYIFQLWRPYMFTVES